MATYTQAERAFINTLNAAQAQQQSHQAQQQMAQIQNSYGYGGLTTTTGSLSSPSSWIDTTGTPIIFKGASTFYSPAMYVDDEWRAADNQEAAGYGWSLVHDTYSPKLIALSFGTKSGKTPEEILTDVVEHAMTGDCPIAYKLLCTLSKNRSPYQEWEDTCKALADKYDTK